MLQPSIILLKDGTDTSQGIGQTISNINACEMIANIIKSTLGPCGMDKLIYEGGDKTTISNDGATIMRMLEIVHPGAQTLVDIARSQDEEVGDGTTSVVILAAEFLSISKQFLEDGIHPQIIISAYRKACQMAKERINELAVDITEKENTRDVLEKCGATALNSKLISSHAQFFSKMVVDACLKLEGDLDLDLIGIKKEPGGSLEESQFIEGVAFKKCFSYAGFEQQPKKFTKPTILLLNLELELKAEKENIEVRVDKPEEFKDFVNMEWKIIYDKLDRIIASGVHIVLSRLAIGDLATQYFADRGIFCAGRVPQEDLARVAKATGGRIQTTVSNITPDVLGTCGEFEEKQIGSQRYNLLTGCVNTKTATIILRGGGKQFIEEAERSIHDAIMIVRRAMKYKKILAGGGAVEIEVSRYLSEKAKQIPGKQQTLIRAYAKAFESIPRQLAQNAGFDPVEILAKLRKKHKNGGTWFGVDIVNEDICDTFLSYVWEPSLIKLNCIEAATEAACTILSIDKKVKNPKASNRLPQE
jgi:T-complex protein 1 subunit eta